MRRFLIILPILFLTISVLPAFAQDGGPVPVEGQSTGAQKRTVNLVNPLDDCPPGASATDPCRTTIPELVSNIIKAFVGIVGAVALLIFVYGGFLWLTSAGEASKIQAGKDAMKWAVVGLVVVLSSYALVSFVLSALTKRVG
jgi:hypothetical protein